MFLADYLILHLSFSDREVLKTAETAHKEGKRTILYSIPDQKLSKKLLRYVSIAIFDELQVGEVTSVNVDCLSTLKNAVLRLYGRGVERVIVKMRNGKTLIFAEERFIFLEDEAEGVYKINSQHEFMELKKIVRMINDYSKEKILLNI